MANCFVKEGLCGNEIIIKAKKNSQTKVVLEFETTCKYINFLAKDLKEIKIGEELASKILETTVYRLASKHCCRNSCSVPAAILKTIEVISGTSLPKTSIVEFIDVI